MDMRPDPRSLSCQLDEALAMEAHYRALLLLWKQRRQWLEAQIPDPLTEQINAILEQVLDDGDDDTDQAVY